MNQLLHYLYNCNKKKIWITYMGFITISLILLFNIMGSSKQIHSVKQNIILILFILLFCIIVFYISLIAISSFRRMLKNSMIRYTAIPAKKYLYANLLFFALMFILLSLIGLLFVHFFSINIYENKTNGEVQQAMHNLYDYGLFHHLFSILLWITDLTGMLVSVYFIIVIIKLFNVKAVLSKLLFIFFFLILGGIQFSITTLLEKIDRYVFSIKSVGVIDKNGFFETSFYFSEVSNVSYVCFSLLSIILLVFLTSYIIDRKLEV